ncbi:Glyoxylase, beta-lactamase superfamily II [Seinonella peptonophila]|uniref:Glyoxylase, beta-lactamase superfamily II n=1 Tax=Seinonella peptonophila TaxID=112248 RepID=A0A1M4X674_9BACL|nr:MBL fold metallo-hydrolase [Seinonella peptonophila]SHE88989.1 Glyoxylase, beta-lactamase superfamily II [Seinonella peptonophila]
MSVGQGLMIIPISAPVMGKMDTVYPILFWDEDQVVLVDTGFPDQLEQLYSAFHSARLKPARLKRIIMTHQDIDHIGNLQSLLEDSTYPIEVYAHKLEKPYIEGEKRILRFTDQAIASIDQLPKSVPASFREGLKRIMLHPPKAPVSHTISDQDHFAWCGGLIVIETPGHTPGHISLYHQASKMLIAGDALIARDGQLHGPDRVTSLDHRLAQDSVKRLLDYEIESVLCYHGGIYEGDVQKRLQEIVDEG